MLDERLFAMQDVLLSVSAIANSSGLIQERYLYSPFGAPKFLSAAFAPKSGTSFEWETLYGGYRGDLPTGMYLARARILNYSTGMWLSRDPAGPKGGGISLYQYAASSPVCFRDPTGRDENDALGYANDVGCQARHTAYCADSARSTWASCVCYASGKICDLAGLNDYWLDWAMDDEVDINTQNARGNTLRQWLYCTNRCIFQKWQMAGAGNQSNMTQAWRDAQRICSKPDKCSHNTHYSLGVGTVSYIPRTFDCCKAEVNAEMSAVGDCEGECGKYLTGSWGTVPTGVIQGGFGFGGSSADMGDPASRLKWATGQCCTGQFHGPATEETTSSSQGPVIVPY